MQPLAILAQRLQMSRIDNSVWQDKIIQMAEQRLGKPLSMEARDNIFTPNWSGMGLEMIEDTVRTIEIGELEGYLLRLRNNE